MYERLWAFQKTEVDYILHQKNVALFAEQGTGKTWITAGVIDQLMSSLWTDNFEGLVIARLSNKRTTWLRTLKQVSGLKVYQDWDKFRAARCPKVFLIHYQEMPKLDKKLSRHNWSLVVIDESQHIKARNSKSSRIAGRIRNSDYKVILSGTPFDDLTDDPQEIWAQMRFLAPWVLGTRWKEYDELYLTPTGYMGYKRKFRPGMLDRILEMVQPYCRRVTKDVLDLPPLEFQRIRVPLFGRQRRIYEEMKTEMVTELTAETNVTADLVITQLVKLQQICGGFIKDDEGEIHQVGRAKLRRLARLLENMELPVVIFAKYLEEIRQIETVIPPGICNVASIIGRTRKTRDATLDAFQRGEIDVLIAQVRTGGVGIDLQRACNGIFYSSTFSFIDFDQAVSRLHRAGQTRPVKFFLLGAENTVDMEIYNALLSKQSISELILSRFQTERRRPEMAKSKDKTADKAEAKVEAPKYAITDLADALDITPAAARVKLRANKIAKNGGRYGWDSKAELNEIVNLLKAAKKTPKKKAAEDDGDEDEE